MRLFSSYFNGSGWLAAALLVALPAAAHAQGSLEGTVRDGATNQGLAGAQVFISVLSIG